MPPSPLISTIIHRIVPGAFDKRESRFSTEGMDACYQARSPIYVSALERRVSFYGTTNARVAPPWPFAMKLIHPGQGGQSEVAKNGFWRQVKRCSARLLGTTCDCREAQERLEEQLDEVKGQLRDVLQHQLNQSTAQQGTTPGAPQGSQDDLVLISQNEKLTAENSELLTAIRNLNEENSEYMDKIISLQVPREELTPNVAAKRYISLLENIDTWVNERVAEILQYTGDEEKYVLRVKKMPAITVPIKDRIRQYSDIHRASIWPEAETITLCALISRFLDENLFQMPIYGTASPEITFIDEITEVMSRPSSKNDPDSIRRWVADSYRGLMETPGSKKLRDEAFRRIVQTLVKSFRFLVIARGQNEMLQRTLMEEIVQPAFELQEDMLSSTRPYDFDLRSTDDIDEAVHSCRTPEELDRVLKGLDLVNAANDYRKLEFKKLTPKPTLAAFQNGFKSIAVLSPALVYMEVPANHRGGHDASALIPVVAVPQKMLVSWVHPGSPKPSLDQLASWLERIL